MTDVFRIATRQSPLALWQAEYVKDRLLALYPTLRVELVKMVTQGDKILDTPLAKVGGKGLFVKELELGLLQGEADIAVHSMKDVPVGFPEGLHLAAICPRENPFDAFVSNHFQQISDLPPAARVGTSSMRRQCQLRAWRPDLKIVDLRGNVNTRLRKLDEGHYDAVILACAGLIRLGFSARITQILPVELCLPAVGQGAVGIEARVGDQRVLDLIAPLNDLQTQICVTAERAMNAHLEGGCQVPIAGFAELKAGQLNMSGLVGRPDGSKLVSSCVTGKAADAVVLGKQLAEDLLGRGAGDILRDVFANG